MLFQKKFILEFMGSFLELTNEQSCYYVFEGCDNFLYTMGRNGKESYMCKTLYSTKLSDQKFDANLGSLVFVKV